MARGKYVHQSRGPRGPVLLLMLAVAVIAVVFAGTALVRAFHNEDPLPSLNGGQQQEQQEQQQDNTQPPQDSEDLAARRADLLAQAEALTRGYYYDDAIRLLENAGELTNTDTAAMLQDVKHLKESLVKYDSSQYYHIFFHSLAADTAKTFDGDHDSAGYDMFMTTVSEFKAMLPLLQEQGFILYDITDMVELVDGKTVLKDIYLPAGKKPLVLSIDDVNYYNYMLDDGFASRLDVDDQGNVVTIMGGTIVDHGSGVQTVEGGEATYDGDVMPILDAYVREHPEFSWQGAKGIVAITGYAGAFGYRITDLELFDQATQQWMLDKTKAVAQALRASGWQIACHSYTHNQYWNKKTITMEEEQYDIGRWLGEIAPYVGDTNIFISPFGVSFDGDDQRFRYLVDHGFYIYCPVDSYMPCYVRDDYMIQGRINLDGLTMKQYPERIRKHFFDPTPILDPARPK